jgi:hypothetical protein
LVVASNNQQILRVRHGLAMGHTLLDCATETTARTCGSNSGMIVIWIFDVTHKTESKPCLDKAAKDCLQSFDGVFLWD